MQPKNVGDVLVLEGFLRYEVTATRRGGMACVHLLKKVSPKMSALSSHNRSPWQDQIAAKTFLTEDGLDVQFEKELNLWIDLRVPNTVRLSSVTRSEGRLLAVMPQYACSLQDLLDRRGHLQPSTAIGHIMSTCECLKAALETHRVIHLDLKPSNLLLLDSNSTSAHVSDWGIAQLTDRFLSPLRRRQWCSPSFMESQCVVGTLPYLSPERVLGAEADYRDDIYSLGLILIQLATGRLPIAGRDEREIVRSIVTGQYMMAAKSCLAHLSPRFGEIVMRCIAPERSQRYAGYNKLLKDLKELRHETV